MSKTIFNKIKQEACPFKIFPNQKDCAIQSIIAGGNYGVVSKVIGKQYFAMKEMDIEKISSKDSEPFEVVLENAYNEFLIMKKNLKNVVRAHHCFYSEEDKKFYFTMDIMEGSLESYMKKLRKPLTFEEFLPMFQDMVTGLNSLFRETKVVHRDLKPANILFDASGRFFIADVGIAKEFEDTKKGNLTATIKDPAGSLYWMAPEMRLLFDDKDDISKSSTKLSKLDVFSLGFIALFCLDKEEFSHKQLNQKGTLNKNEKDLIDYLNGFKAKGIIDDSFFQILQRMLTFDVKERIDITELYDLLVQSSQGS